MKWYFLCLTVILLFSSCSETEKPKRPEVKTETKPLVMESKDGNYKEWYPGHKQVKLTGRKNKEGKRVGIWKYFSEQGVELSVTVYNNGKKDGHTVVKYPTGVVHYSGEYLEDEPIGVWKFYNEEGELTETKDYSKL